MYFQKFPYTFYSLDDRKTAQVVTNFFLRVRFDEVIKEKYSYYDEYDIVDGETPEIVAFNYYGNPNLHWLVLMLNDIFDPRFEWPLDVSTLNNYVSSKYINVNGTHHYEDSNGNTITGNVILNSNIEFSNINPGDVIYNLTSNGKGYVTSKLNDSTIIVSATEGGYVSGDVVSNNPLGIIHADITSTTHITGTPITNYLYEEELNESKRRIKLVKPSFVSKVVSDLESTLRT